MTSGNEDIIYYHNVIYGSLTINSYCLSIRGTDVLVYLEFI